MNYTNVQDANSFIVQFAVTKAKGTCNALKIFTTNNVTNLLVKKRYTYTIIIKISLKNNLYKKMSSGQDAKIKRPITTFEQYMEQHPLGAETELDEEKINPEIPIPIE